MATTHTYSSIYSNMCTVSHRQCTIVGRRRVVFHNVGLSCRHCIRIIIRNQQRDTRGDGIVASRQGAIVQQDNGLIAARACCIGRSSQIKELISAHAKQCDICRNEHRANGCRFKNRQGCAGSIGQIFAGGLIVPAEELIAACGCGHHSIRFRRDLGKLRSICNGSSVYGVSTALAGLKGSGHFIGRGTFQRNVGNGQRIRVGTRRRCQGDGDRIAVGQCPLILITADSGNGTAASKGIVKAQLCFTTQIVRQGQFGCDCTAYNDHSLVTSGRTRNGIAGCAPAGFTAAVRGSCPGCSQLGFIEASKGACRMGILCHIETQVTIMFMTQVEIHRGEQAEDQGEGYDKGQDPFKISHFFQTSFLYRM